MHIDRNQLAEEIILREYIQKLIKKSSVKIIKENFADEYQHYLNEQKLRNIIRNAVPRLLKEEMSDQEAEDMGISFVRDTLLAVIKIVKLDQSKFSNPEVQDGFIKYCMLALQNDFEENRGEEGAAEEQPAEEKMDVSDMLQEFANDGDGILDIKISPKDDPMYISDEPEEEEEPEPEPVDPKEEREKELYLTLSDEEKVGFRYARDTTWPKVTKQIKKIHKQVIPHTKAVAYYEEWLIKNFKLHGENTKEEMPFEDTGSETEV